MKTVAVYIRFQVSIQKTSQNDSISFNSKKKVLQVHQRAGEATRNMSKVPTTTQRAQHKNERKMLHNTRETGMVSGQR